MRRVLLRRIAHYLRIVLALRPSQARYRRAAGPAESFGDALIAAAGTLNTAELIRRRDQGYALGGVLPALMDAFDTVLTARGVQICPCGASPTRLHTRTCEEA